MKIYAVIICCFIFCFQSCYRKREHMYHFTQHDSLCFDIYDTLSPYVFGTNKGRDTLWIMEKGVEENYNEWYFDNVDGAVFNAFFYCKGRFIHDGEEGQFDYSLRKIKDDEDPIMSLFIGVRYAWEISDYRNRLKTGIYNDTIIIDNLNSEIHAEESHNYIFDYIKWHKYDGIVEYRLSDGTLYKKY